MNDVTLIVPTKGRFEKLIEAIDSSIELPFISAIIIVDDGSFPPLTLELFCQNAASHKIRILQNQLNPGAQGARVTGALAATTDLLLFLDSDDLLLGPGVQSIHSYLIENEHLALAYGNILLGDDKSDWLRIENFNFSPILKNLSLCPFSGLMVRKPLVPWNELNLSLPAWQDDDFCLTVARLRPIQFIDAYVARNRLSSDSISRSKAKQLIGLSMLIEKWKAEIITEFGMSRLFLWRMRQFALLAKVIAADLDHQYQAQGKRSFALRLGSFCFGIIGRAIHLCLRPFFDKIYA